MSPGIQVPRAAAGTKAAENDSRGLFLGWKRPFLGFRGYLWLFWAAAAARETPKAGGFGPKKGPPPTSGAGRGRRCPVIALNAINWVRLMRLIASNWWFCFTINGIIRFIWWELLVLLLIVISSLNSDLLLRPPMISLLYFLLF